MFLFALTYFGTPPFRLEIYVTVAIAIGQLPTWTEGG